MMKPTLVLAALALLLAVLPAASAPLGDDAGVPTDLPAALTTDDVLAMMDKAPAHELGTAPYRWSRVGQANRIASAIARAAETRDDAGDLVVFALFEGGNRLTAVGDGGKSFGPWQISSKRASVDVATAPEKAAAVWLSLAAQSRKDCASLPEDERLAELASGSCQYGRALSRRRAALRRRVLADD